jgi:hypothetical protein
MTNAKSLLFRLLAASALLLACAPLFADTLYLSGRIGKLPVNAAIANEGGVLAGWYFYRGHGRQLHLRGKMAADGSFRMEESRPLGDKVTGVFEGVAKAGRWTGTWTGTGGATGTAAAAPLPLQLEENHDALGTLNAGYACALSERVPKYRVTNRWTLKLAIEHGVVRAFSADQGSYGDRQGDKRLEDDDNQQSCSINLQDLRQVPSKTGILLQARDVEGEDRGEGGSKCSVRIVADKDTLRVGFGEPADSDNDCRRSGTTMFCSPRGDWSDMVIERDTKRCMTLK